MPNVITCYKWVLDEADIRVEGNGALNFERAGRKISEYDRNAIEAAVQIQEQKGGSVVAVSLGGPELKNSAKDALSRGPERAVLAIDPAFEGADSRLTALGLAEAVRAAGAFDLIICGEGSGDLYAQQVGPRLAALLGIPCVSFVNKLEVTETGIRAERKLEDGIEVVEAGFPVLVTVLPDLNRPRIPGLKQV
ncbi:MAG: electron transfer flavoprotein subunit beta/FixA family protein, partial [Bacillota bacterium]